MACHWEIITDDQDFTHEWLREGQVMGCVTTVDNALRGCKVQFLGAMDYVAVASPGYAARNCPQGLNAHNFRQIPFVAFNRKDDMQVEFVSPGVGLEAGEFEPALCSQLRGPGACGV